MKFAVSSRDFPHRRRLGLREGLDDVAGIFLGERRRQVGSHR